MSNIDLEILEDISLNIQNLADNVGETISWVNSNNDIRMDKEDLLLLKDSKMKLNRINNSFKHKPVFAVFGASQVGKSYLIKNLLSIDGSPLQIVLGEKSYDFLENINPAGSGAESTGVVTRFTVDKTSLDSDFPVKAKLISVSDLVIVLTDCFHNDVDLNEAPVYDDFEKNLVKLEEEFQASDSVQDFLEEDHIFEIRDFFNNNFKKENLTRVLQGSNYWNRIGSLISKVPSSRWVDIFSFYWDNNQEVNRLFTHLISELSKLDFVETLYLKEESILRGGGEILDVTRVKEMFSDDDKKQVVLSNGAQIKINTNKLSAIISEVTLSVSDNLVEKKPFMQDTDLLDFPGARSRLILNQITDEELPLMFLRGKIAYLFKKYSKNLEINNLLFCINDQQIEVNELPSLLNDWISTNIGDSIDNRSKAISNLNTNPLFVILTFFNNQLIFDSTNDLTDLEYKWDNRFVKFFKEGIISTNFNWDVQWTNQNKLFNNFFLLRDYKYSTDIFSGFEEQNQETAIVQNRVDYMSNLRESFLEYPFVKDHFQDPVRSWDSVADVNADGSSLIINNLLPSANNQVKVNNSIKRCQQIQEDVLDCLNKYYVSDNKEEERNKVIKNSLSTSLSLSQFIANDPHKFSLFIQSLLLSESNVYNIFHDNINSVTIDASFSQKQILSNLYPYLSDTNTMEENIEIIRKQEGLSDRSDVVEVLKNNGLDISEFKEEEPENELGIIIDKVFDVWVEQVKSNPNHLENELMNQIIDDLLLTMKVHGLSEKIQDILSPKFNRVQIDREDQIYFAAITTYLINEFVTDFGTNTFDELSISRLHAILSESEKELFSKITGSHMVPNDSQLDSLFDDNLLDTNKNLKNYISNFDEWKLRMKLALLNNCGYIDNEQNNKQVKSLLDSLNSVNISL